MTYANNFIGNMDFREDSQRDRFTRGYQRAKLWLKEAWDGYVERRAQYHAIQTLRQLDDHLLKDIGIHRSEIVSAVTTGRRGRKQGD